jgi:hypothetical protein
MKTKKSETSMSKKQVKAYYMAKLASKKNIKRVNNLVKDLQNLEALPAKEAYKIELKDSRKLNTLKPSLVSYITY